MKKIIEFKTIIKELKFKKFKFGLFKKKKCIMNMTKAKLE